MPIDEDKARAEYAAKLLEILKPLDGPLQLVAEQIKELERDQRSGITWPPWTWAVEELTERFADDVGRWRKEARALSKKS